MKKSKDKTCIFVENLKGNSTLKTFYIRIAAEDDKGNLADYSNHASLSKANSNSLSQFVSAVFLLILTSF